MPLAICHDPKVFTEQVSTQLIHVVLELPFALSELNHSNFRSDQTLIFEQIDEHELIVVQTVLSLVECTLE